MKESKSEKLNLKNDIIFKAFFSKKGNEKYLIDFLNALLKINIERVNVIGEYSLERLTKEEKGGRLDIRAELDNGTVIDIEMQVEDEHNMDKRSTYYAAKLISRETEAGTEYKDVKPVIMINILDFEMLGFDEYISETEIVLKEHKDYEIIKGIKWYFIELPKFRKQNPDMNEKINQWIAFIDDYNKEMIEMAEEKNRTLKDAGIELHTLTGDKAMQRLQEYRESALMEYNSKMGYAEEKRNEEAEWKNGMEDGKREAKKDDAKKMKEENIAIDVIIRVTGLTKEEIEKL